MNPYIGHDSQIWSVEEHRLVGGKGDGMRLLEISSGTGVHLTVSLDRAADIPALIPAALLFFGIAAVLELRKYIRQSEELTWNFTLTG